MSLATNEVFRGESVSGNDPAASLAISFDDDSGLFAGASASVAAGEDDPRISYASQYAGYAVRSGRTSFEAGVIHRTYHTVVDTDYRKDFFEGYLGVSHRSLKARVYVSPDYSRQGGVSYYGEVNARLFSAGSWSVDGHAGLSLIWQEDVPGQRMLNDYRDWRVQASRPLGTLFFSAGVAGTNYPVYSSSGRARVFASLSKAF